MTEMTDYLVRKEAARYLKGKGLPIEARTLANMAYAGRGPKFSYLAPNCAVYQPADLDAWIAATLKPADLKGASPA